MEFGGSVWGKIKSIWDCPTVDTASNEANDDEDTDAFVAADDKENIWGCPTIDSASTTVQYAWDSSDAAIGDVKLDLADKNAMLARENIRLAQEIAWWRTQSDEWLSNPYVWHVHEAQSWTCEPHPGAVICFHGLQSASELNGEYGVVNMWHQDSGRWSVTMSDGEEKIAKPENLMVVTPAYVYDIPVLPEVPSKPPGNFVPPARRRFKKNATAGGSTWAQTKRHGVGKNGGTRAAANFGGSKTRTRFSSMGSESTAVDSQSDSQRSLSMCSASTEAEVVDEFSYKTVMMRSILKNSGRSGTSEKSVDRASVHDASCNGSQQSTSDTCCAEQAHDVADGDAVCTDTILLEKNDAVGALVIKDTGSDTSNSTDGKDVHASSCNDLDITAERNDRRIRVHPQRHVPPAPKKPPPLKPEAIPEIGKEIQPKQLPSQQMELPPSVTAKQNCNSLQDQAKASLPILPLGSPQGVLEVVPVESHKAVLSAASKEDTPEKTSNNVSLHTRESEFVSKVDNVANSPEFPAPASSPPARALPSNPGVAPLTSLVPSGAKLTQKKQKPEKQPRLKVSPTPLQSSSSAFAKSPSSARSKARTVSEREGASPTGGNRSAEGVVEEAKRINDRGLSSCWWLVAALYGMFVLAVVIWNRVLYKDPTMRTSSPIQAGSHAWVKLETRAVVKAFERPVDSVEKALQVEVARANAATAQLIHLMAEREAKRKQQRKQEKDLRAQRLAEREWKRHQKQMLRFQQEGQTRAFLQNNLAKMYTMTHSDL